MAKLTNKAENKVWTLTREVLNVGLLCLVNISACFMKQVVLVQA